MSQPAMRKLMLKTMLVIACIAGATIANSAAQAAGPAAPPVFAFKADSSFSGNNDAAVVARILMPIAPQSYGDSEVQVKTVFRLDPANTMLTVSFHGRAHSGHVIDIQLTCQKFSLAKPVETLYVEKSKETDEIENGGTSTQSTVRAECVNQKNEAYNIVALYDRESFAFILNEGSPLIPSPRFDVIVGRMPKK